MELEKTEPELERGTFYYENLGTCTIKPARAIAHVLSNLTHPSPTSCLGVILRKPKHYIILYISGYVSKR